MIIRTYDSQASLRKCGANLLKKPIAGRKTSDENDVLQCNCNSVGNHRQSEPVNNYIP